MRKNWRTCALLIATMAAAPLAWASSTDEGTLTGTVVDDSGKPMRGVMVSAIDHEHQKSISVMTDTKGRFILDRLPAKTYDVRARVVAFEDTIIESVRVEAGDGNKKLAIAVEPLAEEDLILHRKGVSLFGEMEWENDRERMSFKMSCTYCHQIGTYGFRTPEEPVDWEVMITRMDGFGALHRPLRETLVERLVNTYAEKAVEKWDKWTPPEPPSGKVLAMRVTEWDLGNEDRTMIHDLELGKDGLVYAVDMTNDALISLNPETGERITYGVPGGKDPGSDDQRTMGPHSVEADADGNMWVTMAIGGKMGKFDVTTKEWTIVSGAVDGPRGGYPHTLRVDHKTGLVWYTDAGRGVFSLDPSNDNKRTFYRLPAANQTSARGTGESRGRTPYGIDIAPNGYIWYSKVNANRIGRIIPGEPDTIKEWNPPFRGPRRLHVSPIDGMVWIPACGSGVFAKFDPDTEEFTVYDLPDKENQFPYALSIHPQTGDIWICGTTNDSMFRFIPETEELIEYPMPSRVTYTREVEFAEDGSVWVSNSNWPNRHTERGLGSIIRISLDGTVDELQLAQTAASTSGD